MRIFTLPPIIQDDVCALINRMDTVVRQHDCIDESYDEDEFLSTLFYSKRKIRINLSVPYDDEEFWMIRKDRRMMSISIYPRWVMIYLMVKVFHVRPYWIEREVPGEKGVHHSNIQYIIRQIDDMRSIYRNIDLFMVEMEQRMPKLIYSEDGITFRYTFQNRECKLFPVSFLPEEYYILPTGTTVGDPIEAGITGDTFYLKYSGGTIVSWEPCEEGEDGTV